MKVWLYKGERLTPRRGREEEPIASPPERGDEQRAGAAGDARAGR